MARQQIQCKCLLLRQGTRRGIQLLQHLIARQWHERVYQGGEHPDQVGRKQDDSVALGSLLGEKRVIETGLRQQQVATRRQLHHRVQTCTKLADVHKVNILGQDGIHVSDKLGHKIAPRCTIARSRQRTVCAKTQALGCFWKAAFVLFHKRQNTIHKVAEVLQQLRVVPRHKVMPHKLAV